MLSTTPATFTTAVTKPHQLAFLGNSAATATFHRGFLVFWESPAGN